MTFTKGYCYNRDGVCEEDHCRCDDEPELVENSSLTKEAMDDLYDSIADTADEPTHF